MSENEFCVRLEAAASRRDARLTSASWIRVNDRARRCRRLECGCIIAGAASIASPGRRRTSTSACPGVPAARTCASSVPALSSTNSTPPLLERVEPERHSCRTWAPRRRCSRARRGSRGGNAGWSALAAGPKIVSDGRCVEARRRRGARAIGEMPASADGRSRALSFSVAQIHLLGRRAALLRRTRLEQAAMTTSRPRPRASIRLVDLPGLRPPRGRGRDRPSRRWRFEPTRRIAPQAATHARQPCRP